jgi:3-phenylpropionate/cinnamic acid dioxygenase small subunit
MAEKDRILEQLYRYAWLLDEKRFEEWLELFDEDASYVVTTQENVRCGYAFGPIMEKKESLAERLAELEKLWWVEPVVTSHLISNPIIELVGRGEARTQFHMTIYKTGEDRVSELFVCAKCWVRWRKTEKGWRIREFKAVLDSDVVPGVLEIPV